MVNAYLLLQSLIFFFLPHHLEVVRLHVPLDVGLGARGELLHEGRRPQTRPHVLLGILAYAGDIVDVMVGVVAGQEVVNAAGLKLQLGELVAELGGDGHQCLHLPLQLHLFGVLLGLDELKHISIATTDHKYGIG